MSFFTRYLRQKSKAILIFVFFAAVLFLAFFLYKIPLQAVAYPISVCAFFGIIYLLFDGLKKYRRHIKTESIKSSMIQVTERLSEPETIYEKDLIDIIENINNELLAQKNISDEKYRDMTDYYTMWAHQIKTPIASMKLTLQNAESAEAADLRFDLQRIEQYVEAVMCYLKLSGDSNDLVLKKYSLAPIVRKAIAEQSHQFIRKKIKLSLQNFDTEAVTDEKWILFVIGQILSNSLKYTQNGGTVEIFIEGNLLHIKDNGIGIEKSDLPRIFEKGYTGGNGRKERTSSGIGLYLCKMTCDMLGHGISAVSDVDCGTDIIIDFTQRKTTYE